MDWLVQIRDVCTKIAVEKEVEARAGQESKRGLADQRIAARSSEEALGRHVCLQGRAESFFFCTSVQRTTLLR
jgi:hypothetical protein